MIEQPQEISSTDTPTPYAGVVTQVAMMVRALLASPVRTRVILLSLIHI